ncbi:hypothetical protein IIC68_02900, partial [archaeon]|nr:hypothetical protein [archaeon]
MGILTCIPSAYTTTRNTRSVKIIGINDTINAFLGNSTFTGKIGWGEAVNGTLFTQALWDVNYSANNANWLLDTGILWGEAVNGTLAINSSIASYINAQDIVFNTTLGTYVRAKNDS